MVAPVLSAAGSHKTGCSEQRRGVKNPSTSLRVLDFATPPAGKIGTESGLRIAS